MSDKYEDFVSLDSGDVSGRELNKVMYVDDDDDVRELVNIGLQIGGDLSMKLCSSGQQALEEIEAFQPDLLVLDVVMPGLSGPRTLEAIQQLPGYENVPAIFLTSKLEPAQLKQYAALGAIGVIKKPFNPVKLYSHVLKMWSQHQHQHTNEV